MQSRCSPVTGSVRYEYTGTMCVCWSRASVCGSREPARVMAGFLQQEVESAQALAVAAMCRARWELRAPQVAHAEAGRACAQPQENGQRRWQPGPRALHAALSGAAARAVARSTPRAHAIAAW